ncbi:MAG: 7,8-didemethyl-8-hydroxy-5-deazariboflavin synthase CofG, partial [candidate division NC10 bacterium]
NASLGLMLESVSERLCEPGMPHEGCPGKWPPARLEVLEEAGRLRIPFTTGILVGIGESYDEVIASLEAIKELHNRHGHIQEVIVQNFRAKPGIPMRGWADPTLPDLLRTVAVARLLLGPDMNIQAPPNLMAEGYGRLPEAGLNDWGGISPLTPDHINPEKPWPLIRELRQVTEAAGHELRERLAIYPEYVSRPEFMDAAVRPAVARLVGADGLVRPPLETWRTW